MYDVGCTKSDLSFMCTSSDLALTLILTITNCTTVLSPMWYSNMARYGLLQELDRLVPYQAITETFSVKQKQRVAMVVT